MKKVIYKVGVLLLLLICSSIYANPFTAHLKASKDTFDSSNPSEQVILYYTLSENADNVVLEVFRVSDGAVFKTFNLGAQVRGDHNVIWDGKDNGGGVVPGGDYKFRVTSSSAGYPSWTNTTPHEYSVKRIWHRNISTLGVNTTQDGTIGIGLKNGHIIVTSLDSRQIITAFADTGYKDQNYLMSISNPYSLSFTNNTIDLPLGPFDVASNPDGDTYISPYVGNNTPVTMIDDETTNAKPLIGVTNALNYNSGALDVVNVGTGKILYVSNYITGNVQVYTTNNGNSFNLFETIPCSFTNMVVGSDSNTSVSAVIWGCSESSPIQRWTKSGGAWSQDTSFSTSLIGCGGDYVYMNGTDILIIVSPTDNNIYFLDGTTGAVLLTYETPGTKITSGGNGDLTIKKLTANTGEIYYITPDKVFYSKLTFGFSEAIAAQYKSPNGIAVIKKTDSSKFGHIAVSNGLNELSSNIGAEANAKGVYLLNCDMTWTADSMSGAYLAAYNDPAATWNYAYSDSWSPWKIKEGRDDGILYLGDWGEVTKTDKIYRYDLEKKATALFTLDTSSKRWSYITGKNHGLIISCMSYTSGTLRLIGLDPNYDYDPGYREIIRWDIGDVKENYTGPGILVAQSPDTELGVTDSYNNEDIAIDQEGNLYVVNGRYLASETWLWCYNLVDEGPAIKWKKTGLDLGRSDGEYPCAIDINESTGKLYVLYRGSRVVGVHDKATGNLLETFTYTNIASPNRGAISLDAAGNVYTANNGDECIKRWSPPGANSYTTTYNSVLRHPVKIIDWESLK